MSTDSTAADAPAAPPSETSISIDLPTATHASSGDGAAPALRDRRLVINPSLHVVHCGEDEVLVIHGARSDFRRSIRDDGRTRTLGTVLQAMSQPASLADLLRDGAIADDQEEAVLDLLEHLLAEHVLVGADETPTGAYLAALHGPTSPLAEATVGMVGTGALGARVAEELARCGVGRLVLLDDRVAEDGDVRLLPGHVGKDVGYAEALRDRLDALELTEIEVAEGELHDKAAIEAVFERSDFVVVAADTFASRLFHLADIASIENDTPWVSAYLDGSEACVGPFYVPGETACYNEFEIQNEASLSIKRADYYMYKEAMNRHGLRRSQFVLPSHFSAAAGLLASAVVPFLAYGRTYLVNRCLRLNFERPYVDYEEVLKLPRSPVSAATRHGYRHVFM